MQNHSSRFHKEKLVIYLGCVKFMGHLCITDLGLFEVDKPLFITNKVDKLQRWSYTKALTSLASLVPRPPLALDFNNWNQRRPGHKAPFLQI